MVYLEESPKKCHTMWNMETLLTWRDWSAMRGATSWCRFRASPVGMHSTSIWSSSLAGGAIIACVVTPIPGRPCAQQDAGAGVGTMRVSGSPRKHPAARQQRHGQDAYCAGTRSGRMSARASRAFHHGSRRFWHEGHLQGTPLR